MLNLKRVIAAAACATALVAGTAAPALAADTTVQFEDMNLAGQYAGKISDPFNGVAFYANNDSASYNQYFANGTHTFYVKGCSTNDEINNARVDMYIGGEHVADFFYGGTYPWEAVVENVNHKIGNQEVKFVVTTDNGNWDLKLDYVRIEGAEGHDDFYYYNNSDQAARDRQAQQAEEAKKAEDNQGHDDFYYYNNSDQAERDRQAQAQAPAATIVECETMNRIGNYAGQISDPFNGVALYANEDGVVFNQYFAYGTHNFTLRGRSTNNNLARVEMFIGGEYVGTFYYGDGYPAEYTIYNVNHKTGNQEVKLVVTNDNGSWDANIDFLKIA